MFVSLRREKGEVTLSALSVSSVEASQERKNSLCMKADVIDRSQAELSESFLTCSCYLFKVKKNPKNSPKPESKLDQ